MSEARLRHLIQPFLLLLACFVAQGAWWLMTVLAVAATLAFIVDDAATESRSLVDVLLDGSFDVGGVSGSVLQWVLVVTVVGGLLLLAGTFVVPILLRIFVRVICGARISYAWALIANLASWILLIALTALLWAIPGTQPLAIFVTWIGSSLVTAMLLYPHMRVRQRADVIEPASEPHQLSTDTDIERKAT